MMTRSTGSVEGGAVISDTASLVERVGMCHVAHGARCLPSSSAIVPRGTVLVCYHAEALLEPIELVQRAVRNDDLAFAILRVPLHPHLHLELTAEGCLQVLYVSGRSGFFGIDRLFGRV